MRFPHTSARHALWTGLIALLACAPVRKDSQAPAVGGKPVPGTAAPAAPTQAEILASSDLPETVPAPLPEDPMAVTIHRLSNGLTVYISVDPHKPRYVGWIGVRAGSRHDPADSTGLAHYLEHMLFKGSDEFGTLDAKAEAPHVERVGQLYQELRSTTDAATRAGILGQIDAATQAIAKTAVPNELDRIYSAMGVTGLNAFTSDDQTVYIADVPANRFPAWVKVEAERFADPVFRLFFPELEAVYEEKNLSLDDPDDQAWEAMMRALMPRHPYGSQTTIGEVEHLKVPAYQDMVEFFDRWYVPNNMAVVLAGDVDPATALPALEAGFGGWIPKALPEQLPGEVTPVVGRQVREVKAEGEQWAMIAWLTVPAGHPDAPALTLMDRMLDDAKVGLLNTELELTQKLPEARSWHSQLHEAGHAGVMGRAGLGQSPEAVEGLLMGVIAKLKAGDFTEADVTAAKLQHRVDRELSRESGWGRASAMMKAFVTHRQWSEVVAEEAALAAVTRADVLRVASRYLGDDRVVVYRRQGKPKVPKIDKPKITPVPLDPGRVSAFAKEVLALPLLELDPQWAVQGRDYERAKLPAGGLIAVHNPRNDLFSVTYEFDRGYRKAPLLCHAMELLQVAGADEDDAGSFQKQVYGLGGHIDVACDAEQTWVQVSGPDAQMPALVVLLNRWFKAPRFESADVRRLYDTTLGLRRDELEDDDTLSKALADFAQLDRRSPWQQQPSNQTLERAQPAALRRLITGLFDHQHRVRYFGPRAAAEVAPLLARGKRHRRVGPVQTRVFRDVAATRVFFVHKEGAKAQVTVTLPQGPLPRLQRPLSKLYSEYLSGNMGALVFQEIREARGLAYSAWAHYSPGQRPADAAALKGFLSTQADKTPVALTTFLGLVRTTEIQANRFATAKQALDQEYRTSRIEPRYLADWVQSWDDRGEPRDPRQWEMDAVTGLGAADLQAFAKAFGETPAVITVVGDRSRIDLAALGQLGPVEGLQAADLFSYGAFPAVVDEAAEPEVAPKPADKSTTRGGPTRRGKPGG